MRNGYDDQRERERERERVIPAGMPMIQNDSSVREATKKYIKHEPTTTYLVQRI